MVAYLLRALMPDEGLVRFSVERLETLLMEIVEVTLIPQHSLKVFPRESGDIDGVASDDLL